MNNNTMNMVLKNCFSPKAKTLFSPRKKIQDLENIETYTFICNGELDQNLPGMTENLKKRFQIKKNLMK